jgi:glycosyltransferase involved in cell wall biosynthesis
MLLSVIIPAYNEMGFIEQVLRKVLATPFEKEIIIIDDGSTDGTREYLRTLEKGPSMLPLATESGGTTYSSVMKFIFHEKNAGKGGGVRSGVTIASGDIIIIQDADLEYDPRDYPRLLEPILEGKADVVYGSRFMGGPHRVHLFWHYMGNLGVTLLSNMFSNLNLTDMETGYKVFKREVFRDIRIESNRFGFEPEITAKVAKGRFRIYEVPISYYGRGYDEGKKITWKDGVKAFFTILKYNLFR